MRIKAGWILAGFFLLASISCQKELSVDQLGGTGNIPGGGTGGSLKMKINGVQWVADNLAQASILGGFISLAGSSKDQSVLSIIVLDTVAGTYTLDQNSLHVALYEDPPPNNTDAYTTDQGNSAADAGGTVTISKIDKVAKTISGTFNFKLFRNTDNKQLVITEGIFDRIPYTSQLPLADPTDTFRVKINGVSWTAGSIFTSTSSGIFFIQGAEPNLSKQVAIAMPPGTTPGTYSLDWQTGTYFGLYYPNSSTAYASESGQLDILENNVNTRRIRGNFSFLARDLQSSQSAQLTEGYFSVKY